ncbi:uncharacterized protein KQ657_000611 [Scheffersomyces spartinae]|uniref:Damage-regulated import facilitator 1 n=1 Tax=Scheffersomyces spartinae TaxID=45513 RepID=A0A9P8AHN1_9ASCO|nr:uncharacterized protein KQ657_000611 [Scheffersomyces spartinae]KAG7193542.1 hypothetical protein KQ657_000611 [Scheffersomyces spartinae]
MDTSHKRHMGEGVGVGDHLMPETPGLATLGMRIRRAVAQGYNNVQVDEEALNNKRTTLPAHLAAVPSLMGGGSTIESSSDVASWESRYQPVLQTIEQIEPSRKSKRRYEDDDELVDRHEHEYGGLRFDEEF